MNIESIKEQLKNLHDDAYSIYKPQVDAICSKDASKDEVGHLLDYMFDFCGDKRMILLFKQVCRKYDSKYPEIIAYQINAYRDYYDTNKEVAND